MLRREMSERSYLQREAKKKEADEKAKKEVCYLSPSLRLLY
jgi:hypothetical protein